MDDALRVLFPPAAWRGLGFEAGRRATTSSDSMSGSTTSTDLMPGSSGCDNVVSSVVHGSGCEDGGGAAMSSSGDGATIYSNGGGSGFGGCGGSGTGISSTMVEQQDKNEQEQWTEEWEQNLPGQWLDEGQFSHNMYLIAIKNRMILNK
jgi:hypothetical protein